MEVTIQRRALALLTVLTLAATAWAQQTPKTYLADVATDPATTGGHARLLHYLSQDLPIAVYVPPAPTPEGQAQRAAVVRAIDAWQQAAPDVLRFLVVGQPSADAITVTWRELSGKVASYRYAYTVLPNNQVRYRATEVLLDPRFDAEATYRYALLAFGQAVGLLGRSPYPGDALSATPAGKISMRDVATLRALYALPSGTVLQR